MVTDVKGTFATMHTVQDTVWDFSIPAAGKVGTTSSSKDTWFCVPEIHHTLHLGRLIHQNCLQVYSQTLPSIRSEYDFMKTVQQGASFG